jgi:hypothetical protein|tara:strand:- start:810 stop:1427 length:618 start_codon:yes stop_codon:yes gene_type:complete
MAFVINDRVKETTTTTGTGAFALGGAVQGFETFASGIGNSNTTYYAIFNPGTTEFEVGLGTLDGDSSDLARTTVISSSNSDSAVSFSAGTKDVFCTMPASKAVIEDPDNDVSIGRNLTIGALLKLPTNTANKILVADGTSFEEVDMSGDATIASGGALTLASSGVSAASYTSTNLTVDAKGRITSASSGTAGASAGFVIAMSVAL